MTEVGRIIYQEASLPLCYHDGQFCYETEHSFSPLSPEQLRQLEERSLIVWTSDGIRNQVRSATLGLPPVVQEN